MKNNFPIVFVMTSLIASLVFSYSYTYSAYSKENKQYPYTCVPVPGDIGKVECCTVDIDDNEIWCTLCDDTQPPSNCTEREKKAEEPPTTDDPPIKSDNSFPNDDDKVLDEQQSNPNTPLTNQRVPAGNVGILEQLEDSSTTEQTDSEMTTCFAKKR